MATAQPDPTEPYAHLVDPGYYHINPMSIATSLNVWCEDGWTFIFGRTSGEANDDGVRRGV